MMQLRRLSVMVALFALPLVICEKYLLVTNSYGGQLRTPVYKVNLTTGETTPILPDVKGILAYSVAYDKIRNEVYWIDRTYAANTVNKLSFSNNVNTAIYTKAAAFLTSLALDVNRQLIYVTSAIAYSDPLVKGQILEMTMTGTNVRVVYEGGNPQGIAFDAVNSVLYWSSISATAADAGIFSLSLSSNSQRKTIIPTATAARRVAFDSDKQVLVWNDYVQSVVEMANVDGTNHQVLASFPGFNLYGISLTPDSVFVTVYAKLPVFSPVKKIDRQTLQVSDVPSNYKFGVSYDVCYVDSTPI